ncbi:hypothetical protein PG989_011656 [Apiospora arundinis]
MRSLSPRSGKQDAGQTNPPSLSHDLSFSVVSRAKPRDQAGLLGSALLTRNTLYHHSLWSTAVTKLLENSKKEVTLSSRLHVPYCAHHGDGTEPTPISAITHRCGHRPAA